MADKGLAVKRVMQMHSDDGVFSVMPFRGAKEEPERAAALDPTGAHPMAPAPYHRAELKPGGKQAPLPRPAPPRADRTPR
jgi:hypothetical protein